MSDITELLRKAQSAPAPTRPSSTAGRTARERKLDEARARKRRTPKMLKGDTQLASVRKVRGRVSAAPVSIPDKRGLAPAHAPQAPASIDVDALKREAYEEAARALVNEVLTEDVLKTLTWTEETHPRAEAPEPGVHVGTFDGTFTPADLKRAGIDMHADTLKLKSETEEVGHVLVQGEDFTTAVEVSRSQYEKLTGKTRKSFGIFLSRR